MNEEMLNSIRALRYGSGVSAVIIYLQALYEDTKESMVDAIPEQLPGLVAEAKLLKRLLHEFRKEPSETLVQPDGAYS